MVATVESVLIKPLQQASVATEVSAMHSWALTFIFDKMSTSSHPAVIQKICFFMRFRLRANPDSPEMFGNAYIDLAR